MPEQDEKVSLMAVYQKCVAFGEPEFTRQERKALGSLATYVATTVQVAGDQPHADFINMVALRFADLFTDDMPNGRE